MTNLRLGTGAIPSIEDSRDFKFGSIGLGDNGDSELSADLVPHVRKVRDQSNTNSCGGQAFAGAIDVLTHQSIHAINYGPASALFLYYFAVRSREDKMVDEGIDARSVARVLSKSGSCDENSWPFDSHKVLVAPYWEATFHAAARAGCSYAFVREHSNRIGKLAAALHTGFPIVVGLDLAEDFFNFKGGGTIEKPNTDIIGRHFVLLVGRNSNRFRILNSWSMDWGDNGFAWISDEYVQSSYCWDPCIVYGFERLELAS